MKGLSLNIGLALVSFVCFGEASYLLAEPQQAETVLLFHLDEGKGNIVKDSSPYHNDGTLKNMEKI